ncbi:hypothetical protein GH714_006555 [Hevea brasiliensis]|uniref:Uncharacterized protein n=1 Tax=Hevea brasiliensis TaxID=3981 RepID=A0A6A6NG44_HEVBR|nr:hypothetical protein GH714_006555 [Hevea brasiliensis]
MSKEVDKQESLVSEVDVIQSEVAEHSGKPDPEDSEVVSKEVNKQESLVSEVDVKAEEKSEVTEHRGKPESVEEIGKQQEPPEVLAIKESEAVVKDIEASEAAPKEIDEPQSVVPEVEVTPEEQSEVANQEEKVESIEATEKEQESSEVVLDKESEAVVVKDIEHSAVSEDEHKPESVIPAEVEMKREEQSVVLKVDEKPESLEAEADLKLKVGYEVPEKVETKSIEEKTEPVVPVVGVKPQEEIDVIGQVEPKGNIKAKTVMDEGTLADKVEDTASLKEEKTSKEEEPSTPSEQIVLAKQEAEADRKESIGESPLPDVRETIDAENGKKETDRTEVVEAPLKEATVEQENGGQETEEKTSKTEDENIERKVLNKELVQPIKVDDKGAAVSIAEVTERSSEGEKTGKVIEPVVENKKKENIKEETPALVETSKDGSIEGKLDEAITAVTEPVKESQDSGLEVKDEESAKTSEDKVGKENAEEIAKSDAHNLEPSTKNGDDAKASQDLPREVPAKPIQKQSNNILTKVKHSLVKAKKAIIGKSPSSKTLSSDTKGDIKVK